MLHVIVSNLAKLCVVTVVYNLGKWTYTHTIRRPEINDQSVELRMPITEKDYEVWIFSFIYLACLP